MRMHKLKLGKMFNKDVHSSPRSVHCMCLCSRFMCTNYKISTCIMCTISVRHLVQMARALLFPSARFVSFSVQFRMRCVLCSYVYIRLTSKVDLICQVMNSMNIFLYLCVHHVRYIIVLTFCVCVIFSVSVCSVFLSFKAQLSYRRSSNIYVDICNSIIWNSRRRCDQPRHCAMTNNYTQHEL